MNSYKIYPSLLDAFQHYLDSEVDAEAFSNLDSEGNYRQTADEIAEIRLRALIDKINRVPVTSEAMEQGTAFNELIDAVIEERYPMLDCHIQQICTTRYNNREWRFVAELVKKVAQYVYGSVAQTYGERVLETAYGDVLLYGYADYILRDKIIDLKTTAYYTFGKYERGWQRYAYPYIFGQDMHIHSFVYLAVQMHTDILGNTGGTIYEEEYTHTSTDIASLRNICERFIEFLNSHREQITDLKIFGNE